MNPQNLASTHTNIHVYTNAISIRKKIEFHMKIVQTICGLSDILIYKYVCKYLPACI